MSAFTHRAGLDRLRWGVKWRTLRRYAPSARQHPAATLRYLLFDPELDNFTYEIGNLEVSQLSSGADWTADLKT